MALAQALHDRGSLSLSEYASELRETILRLNSQPHHEVDSLAQAALSQLATQLEKLSEMPQNKPRP